MTKRNWLFVVAGLVVVAAIGGLFVGISQAKKELVFQIWQSVQRENQSVLNELKLVEKNKAGLEKAAGLLQNHLFFLRGRKEQTDRLVGTSPSFARPLGEALNCQITLFETLLEYCKTQNSMALDQAVGRASDWKTQAIRISDRVPKAESMPQSQTVDMAIVHLQQVVSSIPTGAIVTIPALPLPVPSAVGSYYLSETRNLLAEYKGTRKTFDAVLRRYNPSFESWSSFKTRSDYQAEIERRRSIQRRLNALSPSNEKEWVIQNSFSNLLSSAIELMIEGSRQDITDYSKLLSRQVADLERMLAS